MIIGIDPGLGGGIAVVGRMGNLIYAVNTPVFKIKGKTVLDIYAVAKLLAEYRLADRAVIEQVGAMPGQGVTSMFNFGFSTGVLHGALAALEIQIVQVTPQTWKKHMRLPADKDAARRLAKSLWPKATCFDRVKDDGVAEAALIARWSIETDKLTTPDFMR